MSCNRSRRVIPGGGLDGRVPPFQQNPVCPRTLLVAAGTLLRSDLLVIALAEQAREDYRRWLPRSFAPTQRSAVFHEQREGLARQASSSAARGVLTGGAGSRGFVMDITGDPRP
jgi:hypothetical protein